MTQEELISHFCDYRGKCTTDDVAALTFAYRMLTPRWISVEDELPKGVINDNVTKMVLTFSADGYIRLDRYMHYYHRWVNGASEVTHWMPTPQPPSSSEKPNNFKKGE